MIGLNIKFIIDFIWQIEDQHLQQVRPYRKATIFLQETITTPSSRMMVIWWSIKLKIGFLRMQFGHQEPLSKEGQAEELYWKVTVTWFSMIPKKAPYGKAILARMAHRLTSLLCKMMDFLLSKMEMETPYGPMEKSLDLSAKKLSKYPFNLYQNNK